MLYFATVETLNLGLIQENATRLFRKPAVLNFSLLKSKLGFSVLQFWLFFKMPFSVFVLRNFVFFSYGIHCSWLIFCILAFGFWLLLKMLMDFRFGIWWSFHFFQFGFRFLFNLSSYYVPPLILNSQGMPDKPNITNITSGKWYIIGILGRSCISTNTQNFELTTWST